MKQRLKKTGRFAGLFCLLLVLMLLVRPGSGSAASTVVISSPQDLLVFAQTVRAGETYAGRTVFLSQDLDMKDQSFTAIGRVGGGADRDAVFHGIFDGGGHRITGLVVTPDPDSPGYAGFFSALTDAVVYNLYLELTVDGKNLTALGGLAALAENVTLYNVSVQLTADASAWARTEDGRAVAGGLVGKAVGELCVNRCSVTGALDTVCAAGVRLYLGGLAGLLEPVAGSFIANCSTTAEVSATGLDAYAGGFAGGIYGSGTVLANCYAAGYVNARGDHAGGFTGAYGGGDQLINLFYVRAMNAI